MAMKNKQIKGLKCHNRLYSKYPFPMKIDQGQYNFD